jgi:urea transporter
MSAIASRSAACRSYGSLVIGFVLVVWMLLRAVGVEHVDARSRGVLPRGHDAYVAQTRSWPGSRRVCNVCHDRSE